MQKRANQSAAAGAHARLTRGDAYARGRRRFLGILHELKLRPSQKADFSQAKHRLQHQFRDQKFIDFQFLNSRKIGPEYRKLLDILAASSFLAAVSSYIAAAGLTYSPDSGTD